MNGEIPMKRLASLALFAAVAAVPAYGAGTNLDVQSGRATGMAGAVTADSTDPSAVFFNPASIISDDAALRIQVGSTLLMPSIHFAPADGSPGATVTNMVPPLQVYATYNITRDLAVGLGEFTPFGTRVKWPADWLGAQLAQDVSLTTYYFNPEVAYRYGMLKVGAGIQVVRATVNIKRAINFPGFDVGQVQLGGGAWGVGGNVGILVDAMGLAALGINYRSRVNLQFNDGKAHFSNVPPEFQGSAPGMIHDQGASTSLLQPDQLAFGVSVKPLTGLHVNFDVNYFTWQTFGSITIQFADGTTQVEPKHWHHTWNYHLGGEYELAHGLKARLGIMYDPTPNPAETLGPDVPDANRINAAAGLGYTWRTFTADAGYQAVIFLPTTSTLPALPGTYNGVVNLLNVSITWHWDRGGKIF